MKENEWSIHPECGYPWAVHQYNSVDLGLLATLMGKDNAVKIKCPKAEAEPLEDEKCIDCVWIENNALKELCVNKHILSMQRTSRGEKTAVEDDLPEIGEPEYVAFNCHDECSGVVTYLVNEIAQIKKDQAKIIRYLKKNV